MTINIGDHLVITAQGHSLDVIVKVVVQDTPDDVDIEYDILNPLPDHGSYGRWKQRIDGGTYRHEDS